MGIEERQNAIGKGGSARLDRGLAFVEVLAECPMHLHLTPVEAERWVKERMVPVFPLGVKKDVTAEPWFVLPPPVYDPAQVAAVVGAGGEMARGRGAPFPGHLDPGDVAIKFAGAGGDGAQTIALLTTTAAIQEGFDATCIPSYGPESRGGTSYADVHIAATEVLSPAAPDPHVLVAFNGQSLQKFGPGVRPGGVILYDSSVVREGPPLPHARVIGVPCTQIALDLGDARAKNMVALGALQEATRLFPAESFLDAMSRVFKREGVPLVLNQGAFARGAHACREAAGPGPGAAGRQGVHA